ncbi:MAG: DUF72 domain-containing protein, partial [Nitrososphaerales archaeon]|nr:DUF72 domain-containing protein [Nitrososphaerales archaeon]
SYYSQFFDTVEIDSTFYSYPSKGLVYGWSRATKQGFIFSVKLPKLITHKKMLNLDENVESDLYQFLDLMKPLHMAGKLGPILIQLPPKFEKNSEKLEAFLRILPSEFKFACEFRHRSWWVDETWRLLEEYGVANVILDGPHLPSDPIVTAEFAFIRWHGRGKRPWYNYRYKVEELGPWVPKVKGLIDRVKEVYGYFNNHFHGYAVANCLQMLEMLGKLSDRQIDLKKRVLDYLDRVAISLPITLNIESAGLKDLLLIFMNDIRLARIYEIDDREVSKLRIEDDMIEAKVRDYKVLIDLRSKRILHNCGDWEHRLVKKEFCKHIGKIMLILPEDKATAILRRIAIERGEWGFDLLD